MAKLSEHMRVILKCTSRNGHRDTWPHNRTMVALAARGMVVRQEPRPSQLPLHLVRWVATEAGNHAVSREAVNDA